MDDLISRSALLKELYKGTIIPDDMYSEGIMAGNDYAVRKTKTAPAVDAETVCKQMGLVKEAFEMAKADLVAVVRCRDCVHYEFGFCVRSILYSKVPNGYCENGERRADE